MPWKDPERKRAYMKEYSARPEQVAARAQYQRDNPQVNRKAQKACRAKNPQHWRCIKARASAKHRGLEFTITEASIIWPEYCPVLGLKLDYSGAGDREDSMPSFDRWDTTKGYIPGNVFVISWRANRIKWDCTSAELMAVAAYAITRP